MEKRGIKRQFNLKLMIFFILFILIIAVILTALFFNFYNSNEISSRNINPSQKNNDMSRFLSKNISEQGLNAVANFFGFSWLFKESGPIIKAAGLPLCPGGTYFCSGDKCAGSYGYYDPTKCPLKKCLFAATCVPSDGNYDNHDNWICAYSADIGKSCSISGSNGICDSNGDCKIIPTQECNQMCDSITLLCKDTLECVNGRCKASGCGAEGQDDNCKCCTSPCHRNEYNGVGTCTFTFNNNEMVCANFLCGAGFPSCANCMQCDSGMGNTCQPVVADGIDLNCDKDNICAKHDCDGTGQCKLNSFLPDFTKCRRIVPDDGFCYNGKCVECNTNNDCKLKNPDKPLCHEDLCVGCLSDSDCSPSKPLCDLNPGTAKDPNPLYRNCRERWVCGDSIVQKPNDDNFDEECDEGKYCFNTIKNIIIPCTKDSECTGIGDNLCSPRDSATCWSSCRKRGCGDKILEKNPPFNEQCDNGEGNDALSCYSGDAESNIVCNSRNYFLNPYKDKERIDWCTTKCKFPSCINSGEVKCDTCGYCNKGLAANIALKDGTGFFVPVDPLTRNFDFYDGVVFDNDGIGLSHRTFNIEYTASPGIGMELYSIIDPGKRIVRTDKNSFTIKGHHILCFIYGPPVTANFRFWGNQPGTVDVKITSFFSNLKGEPLFGVYQPSYETKHYKIKLIDEKYLGYCFDNFDNKECTDSNGKKGVCKSGKCSSFCTNIMDCPNGYFCHNNECIIQTCDNLFKKPYSECSNNPLVCCKSGGCCNSNKLPPGSNNVCCKDNEYCDLKPINGIFSIGLFSRTIDYVQPSCNLKSCLDPAKPVLCPNKPVVGVNPICCPSGSICLEYSPTVPGFTPSQPLPKTAACGKNTCNADETPCPSSGNPFSGGVQCCDKYSVCIPKIKAFYPMPLCVADITKTKPGYDPCPGTGENWGWATRWCRKGFETCVIQGGYPDCFPIEQITGSPVKTKSTSIYFVREKGPHSLNGKAYVIKPHINFTNPIEIIFNYSNYNYPEPETYKYDDHDSVIASCNSELLGEINHIFDGIDKTINLDDLTVNIPGNATNESLGLVIEEYNLSDCYEKKPDQIDSVLSVLKGFSELDKFCSLNASEGCLFDLETTDSSSASASGGGTFIKKPVNKSGVESAETESSSYSDAYNFNNSFSPVEKEKPLVKKNYLYIIIIAVVIIAFSLIFLRIIFIRKKPRKLVKKNK